MHALRMAEKYIHAMPTSPQFFSIRAETWTLVSKLIH